MAVSTYGSTLFELYGSYQTFIDPTSGRQYYFDENGTEWASGTGPAPTLGNGAATTGFNQGLTTMGITPTPVTTGTTSPAPVATTSTQFSTYFTDAENILTGSLIGGIPNWVLLAATAAIFFMFGSNKHGR